MLQLHPALRPPPQKFDLARRHMFRSNDSGRPIIVRHILIDDEALRAYVAWGFDDLDDGTVRLKCRAANEAALFSNSFTDTLDHLHEIDCPVTLGLAEFTNEGFQMAVPLQAGQLRHGTLLRFPGRTHFGVLERTDEMADVIRTAFAATP